MNKKDFNRRAYDVDWHAYDGPEYYDADRVAPALVALATVENIDMSRQSVPDPHSIYLNSVVASDLMFAVGNDHCGSYYPAAFRALDFIVEVALGVLRWLRETALSMRLPICIFLITTRENRWNF